MEDIRSDAGHLGANLLPCAFVPALARDLLRHSDGRDEQAYPAHGSVLFCDLSGFSRMGADAVKASERGAETLQGIINVIFARVAEIIHAHGGSVLYYAGDAVAAHWPSQGDPSEAVRAASACGLAAQKAVAALSFEGKTLGMRAGVAVGEMWLVDVAGPQVRQAVFCGPVLERLTDLDLTARGVRQTPETERLLGASAQIETDAHGTILHAIETSPHPAPAPPSLEAGPWLRTHQATGLTLGADWVSEFRLVNVLFLRVPGFAFGTTDNLPNGAGILRDIVACIEGEGGTLLQICNDDKGLVAVAAWGLSTSQFEGGAERSVLAAQALTRADQGEIVASIASGKVFAGLIGAEPYFQHVIVGDAINRAAAMSLKAVAPITLDEDTRQAIARRFETREVARLALKGSTETGVFYSVSSERLQGLTHAGVLIGRAREKNALDHIARRLAEGEVVNHSIIAEAGLGKSRLASWYVNRLEQAGVPYFCIQADSIRRAAGYTPFVPLLTRLLGLGSDSDSDTCRQAVLDIIDPGMANMAPLLSPLLPAEIPDNDTTERLSGAGRAEETRRIAARFLSRLMATRNCVLMVEDAQWLDSASWQLMDELSRISPISICLVARPIGADTVPTEVRRLLDPRNVEILELGLLDVDESGELAAQTLGLRGVSPRLAELLQDKAAGHPLFTVALVQALAARNLLDINGGYAHVRLGDVGLSRLNIPDDAAGAIKERISGLSAVEQLTIRTAAVLGLTFESDMLSALHPSASRVQVESDLSRIADTGLIERLEPGGWRFHHAIVADAAYQTLVTSQAQRLHAQAAAHIVADNDLSPDQRALALIAYHYERAGDYEAAIDYLGQAAEGAKRAYANLETADFLIRALALATEHGQSVDTLTLARWQYDVAYAFRALGQYQRAEDLLKRCVADLDRPVPENAGQAARSLLSGYAVFRLRPHRQARPPAERNPVILAADATMMLSEIHYELNKIPLAMAEVLRGANLARSAGGDSATLGKLYIGLALVSNSLPWALDGNDLQSRALEIADRLDDPATEGWIYMVSGNFETGKADWNRGEAHFRHSMAVSESCGERKTWETSCSTLANLKRLHGKFNDAIGWSDITLAASRDRGVVHGIIWSHNGRARDLLCLSRWDELQQDVDAMARLLEDPANALDANDNNRLVFHYSRATLALAEGRDTEALAALEAALEIVALTKRPQVYMTQNAPFYCELLWALRDRGADPGKVEAHYDVVRKSAVRIARQYRAGTPMAALVNGDIQWIQGRSAKAQQAWRRAIATAEGLDMQFMAATALDRLVRSGDTDAEAARDRHLQAAGLDVPRLWRLSA